MLAKFKFNNFYAGVGPTFSYGIGGKRMQKVLYMGKWESSNDKIKFGRKSDNFNAAYIDNAFDLGTQVALGVKAGPIVIDLRFQMGLLNLYDYDADVISQNRSLQLTVGFPISLSN